MKPMGTPDPVMGVPVPEENKYPLLDEDDTTAMNHVLYERGELTGDTKLRHEVLMERGLVPNIRSDYDVEDPTTAKGPRPGHIGADINNPYDFWGLRPENKEYAKQRAEQEAVESTEGPAIILGAGAIPAYFARRAGSTVIGMLAKYGAESVANIAGYYAVEPISKLAGEIDPILEPIVGIVGGIGSAVTLEALISKSAISALSRTAPKFWENQVGAAVKAGSIAKQYEEDLLVLAKRTQEGDAVAGEALLKEMHKKSYNDFMYDSAKKAEKAAEKEASKVGKFKDLPSTEDILGEVDKKIATGGSLDAADLKRIGLASERDAVAGFTKDFDKVRRSITDERAAEIWNHHDAKRLWDSLEEFGGLTKSDIRRLFPDVKDSDLAIKQIEKNFGRELLESTERPSVLEGLTSRTIGDSPQDTIRQLANAPGLNKIRASVARELRGEFNKIYRDEIWLRTAQTNSEYVSKLLGLTKEYTEKLGVGTRAALKELAENRTAGSIISEVTSLKATVGRYSKILEEAATDTAKTASLEKLAEVRTAQRVALANLKDHIKIQTDTTKIWARLKSSADANIAPEYRDQLREFLNPIVGNKNYVSSGEKMLDFLIRKGSEEFAPGMTVLAEKYQTMLQSLAEQYHKNFKSLTYGQLQDIDDFVKAFRTVAYEDKVITLGAKKMYVEEIVSRIDAEARLKQPRWKIFQQEPTGSQLDELAKGNLPAVGKFTKAVSDVASGLFAEIKRIEFITRQLDGFKEGIAWQHVYKRMKDCTTAEHMLGRKLYDRYQEIFTAHKTASGIGMFGGKYWGELVSEGGIVATKQKALAMALNSGAKYNTEILLRGLFPDKFVDDVGKPLTGKEFSDAFKLAKADLDNFLTKALTPADKELVTNIWKLLDEEIWPLLAKEYKAVTGLNLLKEEGHYYPVAARDISDVIKHHDKLTDVLMSVDQKMNAEVIKSAVTQRHGGVNALNLTLDPLNSHLRNTVHLITHWQALKDVQRITRNDVFKKTVQDTMGVDVYNQFDYWLQALARPTTSDPATRVVDNIFRHARQSTTVAALGWKFLTTSKQVLALLPAIPEIGVGNTVAAINKFALHPIQFFDAIRQASPEMAFRSDTWLREIAEYSASRDATNVFHYGQTARNAFFSFIAFADKTTTSIVWQAAYSKGLADSGGNAHKAVAFADSVARRTQTAGDVVDLPRVMRSQEYKKCATMFYSYFSIFHNQAAELVNRGLAGDASLYEVTKGMMWLMAAPAVTWSLMSLAGNKIAGRENEPDYIMDTVKNIATAPLSGIPIARDLANSTIMGYPVVMSPTEDILKEGKESAIAVKKLFTDEQWTKNDYTSVAEVIGYFSKAPSSQLITTIEGGLRLLNGETDDITELLVRPERKKSEYKKLKPSQY